MWGVSQWLVLLIRDGVMACGDTANTTMYCISLHHAVIPAQHYNTLQCIAFPYICIVLSISLHHAVIPTQHYNGIHYNVLHSNVLHFFTFAFITLHHAVIPTQH